MEQGPPTEAQLVTIFSTFYGIQLIITMLTTAHHWSISSVRLIQSTPFQHISLRSILILSLPVCLAIPMFIFLSVWPLRTQNLGENHQMVHNAGNHDIPAHIYLQRKLKNELCSIAQSKVNNWGYLAALVTTVCIVVPNIFSIVIAFPPSHI